MKRSTIFFAGIVLGGVANAQSTTSVIDPATMEIAVPEYVYCEIIADDQPSSGGETVIFDFGQPTRAWAYNWILDADGNKLLFESGVGALNYMVIRGWEFVQAYTSGKDVRNLHYLLRLPCSKLTADQQQQLLKQPRKKGERNN